MSSESTPRLEVRDVSRSFGDLVALDDINLSFHDAEFVAVVGASGCGKSTLLSIIGGLLEASAGEVLVDGQEIAGPGRDRGIVFQQPTLLSWRTAFQNVEFALLDEPIGRKQRRARTSEALADVGLADFGKAYPAQLSGGMQQRVALARSLSYRPEILLMDEPFGALDALTRRSMQGLLTQVWERHRITVMMVTHDIEEAVYTSDRVVVMTPRPGRVREEIVIDLPRPRTPEIVGDARFRSYFEKIWSLIHEEGQD